MPVFGRATVAAALRDALLARGAGLSRRGHQTFPALLSLALPLATQDLRQLNSTVPGAGLRAPSVGGQRGAILAGMRTPTVCAALCAFAGALPAQATCRVAGTVQAWQRLEVRARAEGQVSRVFVQVGDAVRGLDKLVALSAPELLARLGQREAELAAAEEHLQILAEAVKVAQRRLATAERVAKAAAEDLPTAQKAVELQQARAAEAQQLQAVGRASNQELLAVQQQLRQQQLQLRQAERLQTDTGDELEIARLQLAQATLAVSEARHRINAARGRREAAAALVDLLDVKSVLQAARVAAVHVGRGDVVAKGQRLLELVDDDRVRVALRVPAAFAARVKAGAAVQVAMPGGGEGAAGQLARISGVLDGDGCMAAEIELDNRDHRWLPGLPVQAELQLEPQK